MPYPVLNDKLIDCVVRHIEAFPEEYNQNEWCNLWDTAHDQTYCGTEACFAGWTVLLSTPKPWVRGATVPFDIKEAAAQKLGLNANEATHLFAPAPDRAYVRDPEVVKQRLRNIRMWRGLPPREYGLPLPDGDPNGDSDGLKEG